MIKKCKDVNYALFTVIYLLLIYERCRTSQNGTPLTQS
jgi:hypothetical protein